MKFAIALFACVVIAAACGKKITHTVSTDMNLAILKDDGSVFENSTQNKFEFTEGEFNTNAPKSKGDSQFQIMLNEDHKVDRVDSDIWVSVMDGKHTDRNIYTTLNFKLPQYLIAGSGSLKETCYINEAPGTRCSIGSILIEKQNVDQLGNKTRLFRHVSSKFQSDGIQQCDIELTSAGLEWSEASTAYSTGEVTPTYKYATISSEFVNTREATFKLTVTCFKNVAKEAGKMDLRSVFRGEFSQSRVK